MLCITNSCITNFIYVVLDSCSRCFKGSNAYNVVSTLYYLYIKYTCICRKKTGMIANETTIHPSSNDVDVNGYVGQL